VAEYLLVPCVQGGAQWAVTVMIFAGAFTGYLWHNAEPSKVLMGDAGSRFLGTLVATAALVAGNPSLVFAISPVVLANGGGGLVKLTLLRVAKKFGMDVAEDVVKTKRDASDKPLEPQVMASIRVETFGQVYPFEQI
jgi:UDP-N-acetylmuramyl pentapeptide phosphotransferase/UDP-N-acetylglucosamine-1-phosphate transferase